VRVLAKKDMLPVELKHLKDLGLDLRSNKGNAGLGKSFVLACFR
jgi:hypothetical protein